MARYSSKYDEYFEINRTTKEATCKTCGKKITKNCYGMRGHLRIHKIDIEDRLSQSHNYTEYEIPVPNENIVQEDPKQISNPPQEIRRKVCTDVIMQLKLFFRNFFGKVLPDFNFSRLENQMTQNMMNILR